MITQRWLTGSWRSSDIAGHEFKAARRELAKGRRVEIGIVPNAPQV
jgi:hypothetical protein